MKLTARQKLAAEFIKQYSLLHSPACDEIGWLTMKMGITRTAAARLLRELERKQFEATGAVQNDDS